MDLHNVRESLKQVLVDRRLSQQAFAKKHGISQSWLNGFVLGDLDNPRYNTLKKLEAALRAESEAA